MFPEPDLPLLTPADPNEAGLKALGEAMIERPDPTVNLALQATPKAGYTYLGQFIDHDLTLDLTPLSRAHGIDLSRTVNFRTPRLDLEHLYGGGPDLWPFLYERANMRSAARFLIGHTIPTSNFRSSPNDLPRSPDGIALVGDPRQDENVIIAQLHVAFLKLHNAIIGNAEALDASQRYREAGSTFDAARRVLTWHYQWVVRHDFLRQILDEQVFNGLGELERTKRAAGVTEFRIPVEFSLGAFRFGHSMVREDYFYNDAHPRALLLEDILAQTGAGGRGFAGLPADWVIDWERFFFVGGDGTAQHGNAINTQMADGLHKLPGGPKDSPHLAARTLQRGERVRLPSGQAVATALGVPPLTREEVSSGPHKPILEKYGYDTQTPLWYYFLKEAEMRERGGERLGPAGSLIVGRVILDALLSDPNSYLSVDPNWTPTLGPSNPGLFGMAELLGVVL